MISALKKISHDSRIESIKKQTVAAMCIETPFEKDLKIEDGKVEIEGNAGKNYEVTAVWMGEDYISKSFATADENGKFIIKSSGELKDGEYFVLLYGLEKQKNKIIQTEYSTVKFNIVDGKSEVKIHCFRWDFIVLYIIIILITLYSIWRKEKK